MKNVILIVLILSVFFMSGCSEKFIASKDEVFADPATGLIWQTTDTKKKDWEAAIAYCEELDYANHQDPKMTQRYAHLLDEALRRGANVADKVFAGNSKDHDEEQSS